MSIRVLIADDEELVRRGFAMILGSDDGITVIGEAADGDEAIAAAAELRPDLVLMDIRMPGTDGIAATKSIVRAGTARVIVVTTFGDDAYVRDALRAGADGFVLKNTPAEQLIEAVHAVGHGDTALSRSLQRRLIEAFVSDTRTIQTRPDVLDDLTPRELEVLRLVARGCSNAEIAAELTVTDATVKTHLARILAKLGVRDRTQAAIAAYDLGLVAPPDRRNER